MRDVQKNFSPGKLAAGCLSLTRKPLLALIGVCALLAAIRATPAAAQTADLAVTKAGAPLSVGNGGTITYTISVTNAGPNDGSSVTITDVLPPGVTFVSGSAGCTETLGVVNCVVGALVANTAASATVVVTATPCAAQLTNVVTVAAFEIDPNLLDNTNSAVNAVVDMIAPVIGVCPANITGSTDAGLCTKANVTWVDPTATDNCTASPAVVCSPASGSTFNKGATIVTCTATDAVGLTNACTFTVTINDTEAPVIGACPANITGNTDLGVCTKVNVTWAVPGAMDNCPGVLVACLPASGSTFAKGATIVTCTATDAAGLTSACTFTVTISDTQAPTIACPASITTNLTAGCTTAVTFTNPVVSDNCPGATFVCVPANGSTFALGATMVTCTPTDASLNVGAVCTFTVTVTAAAPTISAQPQNQTTPMGNGVVYSVTAAGTSSLTYQWRSNGVNIAGATASSLAISSLNLASSGNFDVVINNCAGSLTSAAATLTVTPIYGLSFDFDVPLQFTNIPYYLTYNNWINNSFVVPPVALFESPFGGVGPFPGSGSLDMIPNNGTDNTSILLAGNYDFSLPGKTLFASTMFKVKNPTSNTRSTQFGFVTATNLGIADQAGQGFSTVIVQSTAQPVPTYELRHQRRSGGGGLQESTLSGTANLTVSNWYKLNISYTNTIGLGASNYAVGATLQDMGPLGTTPGAVVLSFVTTTNSADIATFRNVYLGLRSLENGGVENRDNTHVWTTPGNIFFVQQPQSQTAPQGTRVQIRALVDGEGPYSYQWSSNGVPIAGARSWNHITPPLTTAGNGATYTVQVTGPANTITSSAATVTVTPQTLAVVSAGSVDGTTVGVMFNQPVNPATAVTLANYSINGTAPVAARVYRTSLGAQGPEGIYVILTPASVLSGSFTVTVSSVLDLSGGSVGGANSAVGTVANLRGADVNPAITGPAGENYSFGPGQFIVMGGGVDIFSGFDAFRYVYTTRTGDFDLVYKIPFMDSVRFTAKAGVDARISLEPGSPGVLAAFNPGPIAESAGALRQFTEGTAKAIWGGGGISWGNNQRLFHPNVWMRFRRAGNSFLRYSSTNGVNWQTDGQFSQSMITPFPPTMLVGLAVCSARNLQGESVQFENFGEFAGYFGAVITTNGSPFSATNVAGTAASITGLVATVTGPNNPSFGEVAVLWQRFNGVGWTNMPTAGATNRVLSIGTVFFSDNGAQYRAVLSAPGALSVTSSVAVLTVTDVALPTVASVGVGAIGVLPSYPVSDIVITFNEPVSAATATLLANYAVTNAAGMKLTVLSASFLGLDPRVIVIKVDGQLGNGTSTVGISGVRDLNNNLLATVVRTSRSFLPSTAPVVMEVYQDIGNGTIVDNLTANALFTAGTPTFIVYSNLFGYNTVAAFTSVTDNYGTKGYTYFVPPTNGNYKFWIRNDDQAALFINPTGTNPLGKIMIASNAAANTAYSVGTLAGLTTNHTLVANQRYYLEVLHKEGTGGDGWSVMWTDPTVNTAPANTVFIPTANLAYPDAVAPKTPVVMEIYTGYNNFIPGFNQLAGLYSATNFPTSTYQLETVNFKYIAGLPDVIGYQKYFGVQPALGNTRLDNYLGRAISYFVAPSNGLYRFYCAVDDVCQLWMNTNAVNSTDAAGKAFIGQSANAFVSTASQLMGQNIALVGGQKYYTEVVWKEGTGGDGIRLSTRSQDDATVPPVTEIIQASLLEYPLEYGRAGAVGFEFIASSATHSADGLTTTVTDGQSLVLALGGLHGAPPYGGFVWFKNGVRILENTFTNYIPTITAADNGAVYTLQVTNYFSSATRSITVNVVAPPAPTVVRSVGWRYGDGFTVTYDREVDPTSATFLGNYQVSGGLTMLSATLDSTRRMVSITTAPQLQGAVYTVTINGVRAGSPTATMIAPNTMTSFSTWGIGGKGILVELFTNIQGSAVADLTGTVKFQNNLPDVVYYTNVFGAGLFNANSGLENYGARISGYFMPTNTGFYRFYVRSDDASQLWMNINSADSQNPAGRTMLIHYPSANLNINSPNAISAPVALNQGQAYYMEGLFKEGGGGDYFQMTFRPTDASGTVIGAVPLDNTVLENTSRAFFGGVPGDPALVGTVTGPPADLYFVENDLVNMTVTATVPPSIALATSYQWQRFDGLGYTNIPGATLATLTFNAALSDDNAIIRALFSAPGKDTNFVTTLHVVADTNAPYILSVGSVDGNTIGVCFNERVDVALAIDAFSYGVNGGIGVITNIILRPDGRSVVLFLDAPVGSTFTVDVYGMSDRAATQNTGDSSGIGRIEGFTPLDVGGPPGLGNSYSCNTNEIDVIAGGADIWGTSDQGHMTLRPITGNFDVWARLQSLTRAVGDNDGITKAGIMVRESFNPDARKLHYLAEPPASVGGRDIYEAGQRPGTAAATAAWAGGNGNTGVPAGNPNTWIRIKRTDNLFSAFRSSDGVNWTLTTTQIFALPGTLLVGLGTTAHVPSPSAATTLAEYRNIHIPQPPTFIVDLTPPSQSVPLHSPVSFTVTAINAPDAGPLAYRWYRNGVAIPGANSDTFSLADAMVADGGTYTVTAGNDGGVVTSQPSVLEVLNGLPIVGNDMIMATQGMAFTFPAGDLTGNDTDPEANALNVIAVSGIYPVTYGANFDDGLTPTNSTLFGSVISASGGANNTGYLKINDSVAGAAASFILNDLTPGRRVQSFSASFLLRVGDGSAEPADGFSFNFAPDLTLAAGSANAAEQGSGTGFSFCLDNYRFAPLSLGAAANAPGGGTANTSGLKINYGNVIIAGVQIPTWNTPRFVPVTISVSAAGQAVITVDGTNVFGTVTLPGYAPRAGRFGMYGRTGGQTETHWMDDLSITALTLETTRDIPPPNLGGGVLYGNAYVTNGNGTANSGSLHLTDNINGQAGSLILTEVTPGKAVAAFSASFDLRIGNGTGNAADGFSFNLANDLDLAASPLSGAAEEGSGTGLSLCIDNYPTGGPDSPSFKLKLGGVQIGLVLIPKWNTNAYIPVSVLLTNNQLTVTVSGTNVVAALPIPYSPIQGRFGFYARTGGENETHWMDNLAINVTAVDTTTGTYAANFDNLVSPSGTVTLTGGQINYTPPAGLCGSDTFYYLVSDGQLGGVSIGQVDVVIKEAVPTPPVIVTCPPNRILVITTNCQPLLPDLRGELVATDNCCCLTVTQDPAPGTQLSLGTYVIRFAAIDTAGLSNSCAMTVQVVDQTAPVVVCSSNITVECLTQGGTPVSYTASAADVCDPSPLLACAPVSGSTFPVGVTTVTCTASDASLNTNTCTFTVTVEDTLAPSITCPSNILVNLAPGICTATVTFGNPVIVDCDTNAGITCTPASGSTFPAGTNVVTCVGYDTFGHTNTCSFLIAVIEDLKPAIVCPPDLTVECGDPTTPPATGTATASDNCDLNVAVSYVDGTAIEVLGTNLASWVFSTVGDPLTSSAGLVSGPGAVPLGTGSLRLAIGSDGDNVAQARNTDFHNAPLSSLTELAFSTWRTAGGANQSVYLILNVDLNGDGLVDDLVFFEPRYQDGDSLLLPNQGTLATGSWQSWNAMIGGWYSLNYPGIMSAGPGVQTLATYIAAFPSAKIVNTTSGSGGVRLVAGLGLGGWVDFDGSVDRFAVGVNGVSKLYDFDNAAGNAPLLNQIVRTWTAVDDSGNAVSCSQVINVRDITAPVITCSSNLVAECNVPGGATVSYVTTANDACDGAIVPVCQPVSGSTFSMGMTTVLCSAVDAHGNSNSCSFTITVRDTTAPTIACSTNRIAECIGGLGTPVTFLTTASDVCDTNIMVNCTPASGSLFPLGITTVGCSVVDVSGNNNSCSFTVTVQDTTPPAIVCSPNRIVECTGPTGAISTYVTTASDVCDTVPGLVCSPVSGSLFAPGLTTVNCLATDATGNSNACSFTITVVDTTPPTIACSTNITVECTGPSGQAVAYVVTTSDLCDTNPVLVCSPVSGSTFLLGVATVNCVSTDASSNSNACSFTVTVSDTTPPVINCPANRVVECGTPAGSLVNFTVTATDICDASPVITSSRSSGSIFPPGVTTVTNVARDASGNSNTCTFTVTVRDTTAPVRCANPPVVATVGTIDSFTGAEPSSPSANLLDRLGAVDLRGFDDGGEDRWLGHSFGGLPNYISEATVRIKLRADVGVTQNDTVQLLFSGAGGSLVPPDWTRRIGSGFDATPGVLPTTWSSGSEVELVLNLGRLTNANATVTDLLPQLRALRYLDVVVQDDTIVDYITLELTICQCQPDVAVQKTAACGANVSFVLPPFADNCDPSPAVVCVPASGSFFAVGGTLVTCTATDASGNHATCSFTVTVLDIPVALTILQSGTNVVISWPTTCSPAVLEGTGSLNQPISWSPVGAPVVIVGPLSQVTLPASGQHRYFRLRQ